MIWAAIANYIASHAVELAGFVITALGIWLTTRGCSSAGPSCCSRIFSTLWSSTRRGSIPMRCCRFSSLPSRSTAGGTGGVAFARRARCAWFRFRCMNLLLALAAGVAGSLLLGALAVRIHAALPHLDAALTSYSLVASWWQARKHIANWWLWIVVDAVYIGEYIYKNLLLTAVLYAGLVALAVLGLRDWRRAAAVPGP